MDFGLGEIIGGGLGLIGTNQTNKTNMEINAANLAAQKDAAQHGISWKVADSIAAGIHPLVGLGAQTSSVAPQSIGATDQAPNLSKMGQGIGRALEANMTAEQREDKKTKVLMHERQHLENDLLRTKLASETMQTSRHMGQIGPPVPLPRSGPSRTTAGDVITEDKIKQQASDAPKFKQMQPFGIPLKNNPYFADAESVENRYGDWAEKMSGFVNFPADVAYTIGQSGPWRTWEDLMSKRFYKYENWNWPKDRREFARRAQSWGR